MGRWVCDLDFIYVPWDGGVGWLADGQPRRSLIWFVGLQRDPVKSGARVLVGMAVSVALAALARVFLACVVHGRATLFSDICT